MILVTLGTQDKSFERLLKALEKELKKGTIQEEVIVQAGYTKFKSDYMKIFDLIPSDEFDQLIKKCDILITHGGVGSILAGVKNHKKVIAVPRLSKYKEHTNDHQIQIVHEFAQEGYLIELNDLNKLGKVLEKARTWKPKKFKSNTEKFVQTLEDYIEKESKKTKKEQLKQLWNRYKELALYLVFGVLTTVVSLATYFILVPYLLNPDHPIELQIANVISWIVSVTFAYFTNRKYVFESKSKNRLKEAISFYSSRLVTLLLDIAIMFVGVTLWKGNDKIMKLVSQVVVIVLNYVLSKLFVFKKK